MKLILIFILLLISQFVIGGILVKDSEDTMFIEDKIYKFLFGNPCVILANETGSFGCSSSMGGNIGTLYPINSTDLFDKLISSKSVYGSSVIPVIDSAILTDEILLKLDKFSLVSGLIVATLGKPMNGFSPDQRFPNKLYGLHSDSTHEWNPLGNALNFNKFTKPIFNIDSENSTTFMDYAKENIMDSHWPKWSVELTSFMYNSQDTKTCLRRRFCDPIGGLNIVTSFEKNLTASTKKTVLAVSNYDATSLFHTKSIGADSEVSGLVALLGAIDAISAAKLDVTSFPKQIVFAFFTAESYGYIGSKRLVKDIQNCTAQKCDYPQLLGLKLANIDSIVEMKQVGMDGLYIHQEATNNNTEIVNSVMNSAKEISLNVQEMPDKQLGIPPSSSMSFLSKMNTIPSVVIADHASQYKNKYYQSIFDDFNNIDVSSICKASTLLVNTLLKLASTDNNKDFAIRPNCTLIQEIAFCLTSNVSCSLFRDYLPNIQYIDGLNPTNYAGVYNGYIVNPPTKFIHDFVSQKTFPSNETCTVSSNCPENSLCISKMCVSSNYTLYHAAYSTAFEVGNDGWEIVDTTQPMYTESVWSGTGMRLFLTESPSTTIFIFVFGLFYFAGSFVAVILLTKYFVNNFKLA